MTERDLFLITHDFLPSRGGVARYLGLFAEYFQDRLQVVTGPLKPGAEFAHSYPLKTTTLFYKWIWPHWLKTVFLLMQESRTYRCVVVSHVIPFGTAAMVAKWFTKKPYIVIVHGMDVRLAMRNKRQLLGRVLSQAYLVVANSNALAQELQQTLGLTNILTIYPPVHPSLLPATVVTHHTSSDLRLLSVGRLVDRKGHERVLQALALLKMNGSLTSFRYTIAGDGPMKEALISLSIELKIDSHVVFLGDVSDDVLTQTYQEADVFVLPIKDDPIDKEGFGMVFLEAAGFGIPSIATRMNGVDEAVIDGETGLLIEDGNIEELATTILTLATDEELRIKLGQAARARVLSTFSPKEQFSKLEPYLV